MQKSLADRQMRTSFLTLYATLCLILAGMGLYAVLSYAAQKKKREIAVRMALGADRSNIFRSVLQRAVLPVISGICLGMLVSTVFNHLLAKYLYGISPGDPVTYIGVVIMVALIAAIIACIPAWQASTTDPSRWLRHG